MMADAYRQRPPSVEVLREVTDFNKSIDGCSFVAFNQRGVVDITPVAAVAAAYPLTIQHDTSYFNQYRSMHTGDLGLPRMLSDENIPSHCEIKFASKTDNDISGVTLVMDCAISYIRSGPHGGGLLRIGSYSLSRALLEDHGLLDGSWHTYCVRLTDTSVSVLVDWELEIENRSLSGADRFLSGFFNSEELLHGLNDVQQYEQCGNIIPRFISLCAGYANNKQLGGSLLSTYARVDCSLKNVIAWDTFLPSHEHARQYYHYSAIVDHLVSLAVVLKAGKETPTKFYLPCDVLTIIGEYMCANNKFFSHSYAIGQIDRLFSLSGDK